MKKRIVYYVISCTSEENEKGIFHYSEPFNTLQKASYIAAKCRFENFKKGEGHVAIEKHHEMYERGAWQIDHENGGSEHIDYV